MPRLDAAPDRRKSLRLRILLAAAFGFLWALALVLRLVDLQIMKRDFLREKAENQQERMVPIESMRGFIFDRSGEVLAASTEVESVFASPREVRDADATARLLSSVLGGDPAGYARKLHQPGAFAWIKRKVTAAEAERLRELLPSGVYLMPETKRLYPKGRLASHVLGYVGVDGAGLAGVEQQYDAHVRGTPGLMLALRDAKGSQYRKWVRRQPVHGLDLRLTIDQVAQHVAERETERALLETGARGVISIVLQPTSGRILAMANAPSFDPNAYQASDPETWRNRAVLDTYEPGSTFKAITAASAMDQGLVNPWEQIHCENGAITVARTRISDHDPYGTLTFREIIAKSSNVGAIKVGLRIPTEAFYRDIRRFGFGRRTGIDLPGESPGLLRSPDRWSKVSQASISMGQEVGASPLQMCMAMAAIGNGGHLYRPFVVDRVVGADGRTYLRNHPQVVDQPLSPQTAKTLVQMLQGVVTDGTGRAASIEGLTVAGKTGTAQKVVGGTYSHTKFMASFVGFVPAEDPRLLVGVFVDEPRGKYYGGQVAAPVFRRIAEPLLRSMGLPVGTGAPSRSDAELARVYVPEPPRGGRGPAAAPRRDGATAVVEDASGPPIAVVAAAPPAEPGSVPNLLGQPLRDAWRIARASGLQMRVEGSGVVVRQDPPPGARPEPAALVTAYFEEGS